VNRRIVYCVVAFAAAAALSCERGGGSMDENLEARARKLAHESYIIDTHIDVPYRLEQKTEDVTVRTEGGDFDYPRAIAGGLNLAFMSIYVPASHEETGDAKVVADRLIDGMEALIRDHPDKFVFVDSVLVARRPMAQGIIGLALGIENGSAIQGDLDNLRHFHARGVRYVTLTHSKANHICDSSFDENRPWGGLSPFGLEVVAEMNRLGMMIDVSHLSDEAFEQVIEASRAPVIASHSSCRHFTPGWERNMSDEMIKRLAEAGGVIQINFGSSFISDEYRLKRTAARGELEAYFAERGIEPDSDHADQYSLAYFAEHPIEHTDVADVADHIDHVVQLVGIDHVGLGSDFDGVGDSLPTGLEDVSAYPKLIRVLLERGYTDEQVRKILSNNLLRVWGAVERRGLGMRDGREF